MTNEVDSLSESAQEVSAFYYTVENYNILIESSIKTEIVDRLTVFPMPHTPDWCDGMISLRGKIIPVLNLAYMLGAEQSTTARWLLILESSPLPLIAITIDRLPSRVSYPEDVVKAIDDAQLPAWLLESVSTDELTLFTADHSLLFQQLINENQALNTQQKIDTTSLQDSSEDEA